MIRDAALAPRHKIFISYHHAGDQGYRNAFVELFGRAFDDFSVRPGEIPDHLPTDRITQIIRDEHIRDATVTVVLVGRGTWRRKHVDWEIDSGLRATRLNPRTGLLGILLPSYALPMARPAGWPSPPPRLQRYYAEPPRGIFSPSNLPPRLWDNVRNGFGRIRPWPQGEAELRAWIHEAFVRRTQEPPPDLSLPRFGQNRPESQEHWS